MKGNNFWKLALVFLSSLILCLLVAVLRSGDVTIFGITGFPLSLIVGCICFFALTMVFLVKWSGKVKAGYILIAMLLGACILELPIRIMRFSVILISLPDSLCKLLSIVLAYSVWRIRGMGWKVAVTAAGFAVFLWMALPGYSYWLNMIDSGSFTGREERVLVRPLTVTDDSGNEVSLDSFRGRIVLIDVWSTSCAECVRKFPVVQKLYEKYRDVPGVEVCALFVFYDEKGQDYTLGRTLLDKYGTYSFPNFGISRASGEYEQLDIDGFPTVLIFDKDGTIRYSGNIEVAGKELEKMLKKR